MADLEGRSLGDLLRAGPMGLPAAADRTDIFARWQLATDDEHALHVSRTLNGLWESWTVEQRLLLLDAAEAVSEADRARKEWRCNEAEKARHRLLATQCSDAARLATSLAGTFPPPWDREREQVGQLITMLADFASSGLHETVILEHDRAIQLAKRSIAQLRENTPRGAAKASLALVSELAWLAGGKQDEAPRDESTIRRILNDQTRRSTPGAGAWRKNWPFLRDSARVLTRAGLSVGDRFVKPVRDYLRGSAIQ